MVIYWNCESSTVAEAFGLASIHLRSRDARLRTRESVQSKRRYRRCGDPIGVALRNQQSATYEKVSKPFAGEGCPSYLHIDIER